MEAGRELDALVAEKVMGFTVTDWPTGKELPLAGAMAFLSESQKDRIPHYSTNIAAAWQVVEKLDLSVIRLNNGRWSAGEAYAFENSYAEFRTTTHADTAPLAICLAALKAKGVEV